MWKKLLKKSKCLLGFHAGEWQYVLEGSCGQAQLCVNCGAKSERVEHSWGDWRRTKATSCDETRACARCRVKEQRVLHEWGPVHYQRAHFCEQVQTCTRCGAEESLAAQHQWERWEVVEPDACVEVPVCGRCGQRSKQGRPAHAWGDWEFSERHGAAVRNCSRCGAMMTRGGEYAAGVKIPAQQSVVTKGQRPTRISLGEVVRRRDQIMEPLWQIEEKAEAEASQILEVARKTTGEMQQLLKEWQGSPEAEENRGDTGKMLRYLGDALFSLSGKKDRKLLAAAREAYQRGEPLLDGEGDRLQLAKLNFNLANTLRLIAVPDSDRALMEEARRRYNAARHTFQSEMPAGAEMAEEALQTLEVQLRGMKLFEEARRGRDELEGLMQTLANAAPDDTEKDGKVRRALAEMNATKASPREEVDQFRSFLDQAAKMMPPSGDDESGGRMEQLRTQLDDLSQKFSGEDGNDKDPMFAAMFAELEKATQRGEVALGRSASLRATLQQLQALTREAPKTPEEMVSRLGRLRALTTDYKHVAAEPQTHRGRAGRIERIFAPMRSFLMDETNQSHLRETEQKVAFDLFAQSSSARGDLKDLEEDDAAVIGLEHDRLRPLAYRIRRFELRRHVMFAEPMWGWSDVEVNPNAVFFAGSADLRAHVTALCQERRLQLAEESGAWGTGQLRWNQLRESAVGIFDLSISSETERAGVCHALGSALALGIYPLVVTKGKLPFDIDLSPMHLGDDPRDTLADALDQALFGLYPTAGGSGLEETVGQVLARVTRPDATSRVLTKRLAASEQLDPIDVEKMLDLLIGTNAHGKGALLFPAWPPFYPKLDARRCFHVMPFHHEWSNSVRDQVRKACDAAGVAYRRGDETGEMKIVHSIWEEICRATHVVVDLTGLNTNVCLELALAQALGRKTLLVARDSWTVENLFPEISKLQVRQYHGPGKIAPLNNLMKEFLRAN